MQNLTYRTNDLTRWGNGQGSDLSAVTIDLNFWYIFSAVNSLQATQTTSVSIDFISITGNQLFVHLTNHSVQGPFTIPATLWNPRGAWAPATHYTPLDVVSFNGALYIVNVDHISAASFNSFATDGAGHYLYTLLLQNLQNTLPTSGLVGQRLVKAAGSPFQAKWEYDLVRAALFIRGQPISGDLVLQWAITDYIIFPQGLAGSVAYANTNASALAVFSLAKNGASIGTITFAPSPHVSVAFPSNVACVPGDIITITAPSPQDATLADVSFGLVTDLTA